MKQTFKASTIYSSSKLLLCFFPFMCVCFLHFFEILMELGNLVPPSSVYIEKLSKNKNIKCMWMQKKLAQLLFSPSKI